MHTFASRTFLNRTVLGFAVALLVTGVATVASDASAAPQAKSIQTEGVWVKFDAAAASVTVKVTKPGQGKEAAALKKNKEAIFAVKPEGSVLTRTTVAINGVKAEIADIPVGKTVIVYWRPDEADSSILRARKIDVILSEAELDEKYGKE